MRFSPVMVKYKELEPGSDLDHVSCCSQEGVVGQSHGESSQLGQTQEVKTWEWGRARKPIRQQGRREVACCLTSFFGLISRGLPLIWDLGGNSRRMFSSSNIWKKLFSALFRKGGTRAFLSQTTRNLHEYGQTLQANLLLCCLYDLDLPRVTWGPFR